MRLLLTCALALACLAAPAAAAPLASDNVKLVTKLPEAVGAASARFSEDGKTMYVSTWKGLHIYDITKADDPQRLGFLPLPHFENEDVDAGDGVVIITNDPSEGVGIIYVIDVSNPALPTIASTIQNGDILGSSDRVQHGPHRQLPAGAASTCGRRGRRRASPSSTCATSAHPKFVKTMEMPKGFAADGTLKKSPGFTHDVFIDRSGIAWVTGQDGTFGYSTQDPENPQLVYRTDEKVFNSGNDGPNSPETAQDYPLDFLHHNSIRTGIQLAQKPVVAPGADPAPVMPPRPPAPRPRRPRRPAPSRRPPGPSVLPRRPTSAR